MKLSDAQFVELQNHGFLLLPTLFSAVEIDLLRSRLPALFSDDVPENIVEKTSGEVRTSMGIHLRDPLYAKLVHHPRLLEPAQQIYPEPLYVQQVKVNVKTAFSGEIWQWHYDFATHREEDGVPKPLALNLHVFLDDVTQFNGPLWFIPGSHRQEEHDSTLDVETTSYPLWVVNNQAVRKQVEKNGIISATGKKGTGLIFFDTLIHGSPNNMSPWDRAIFSVILNPVS
ncbi:MAG: phytanoyl-CoA dioxygenase family protein, partial [Dehalococcoidia bacterium]|nr:phytanoyl-CoA dioxygenase family protein [Dehalococcoidia bacterium]